MKEEKAAQKKELASICAEEAEIARLKKQEAKAKKAGNVRGGLFMSIERREQNLAERKNPEIKKQREAVEIKRRTRIRDIYAELYQEA